MYLLGKVKSGKFVLGFVFCFFFFKMLELMVYLFPPENDVIKRENLML